MMESLGNLVDKLSIINIKLFHVQDEVHSYAQMTADTFGGVPTEQTHATFVRLAALNLQRNQAITAIDEALAEAVKTGNVIVDHKIKLV